MESYGELLRTARENKKLTLEAVERETSISKEYLEALENENAEAFHGEAYLTGFLRNYAEYLELDSKRLILLYRNRMIQEAPVPEGLIAKPKPSYVVPLIVISSIVVVFAVAGIIVGNILAKKNKEKQDKYAISEKVQQKTYELSDKPINARVYVGDQIVVPAKDGNVIITVTSDTNSKLGVKTPVGEQFFELSETRELDIDGDATVDMVLDVWEISADDKSRGAEVYIVRKDENAVSEIADNTIIPTLQKENANQTMIFEDNRSYPFTLNASFRKPCVFRYEVDRKNSVENYYTNGDVVTMTANNKVRLWLSNGNTVKFQVIAATQTYELEIAKAGECVVEDIKWIRTDDDKYRLVVEPID